MNTTNVTTLLKTIRASSQVPLVILMSCVFIIICTWVADYFLDSNMVTPTLYVVVVGLFVITTVSTSFFISYLINNNKYEVLNMVEESERYRAIMKTGFGCNMTRGKFSLILVQLVKTSAQYVMDKESQLHEARLAIQSVNPDLQSVSYYEATLESATESLKNFKAVHCLVSNHFVIPGSVAECANLIEEGP